MEGGRIIKVGSNEIIHAGEMIDKIKNIEKRVKNNSIKVLLKYREERNNEEELIAKKKNKGEKDKLNNRGVG